MPENRLPVLTVHVRAVPEAVVVAAEGDLDLGSAPVLRTRAGAALDGRPEALVVDLGGVGFCGSAGLQVIAELVAATTAADVPFALVTDRRAVLRALQLTRLDTTLALHPTLAGARAWLRERA
ncbi:anti-anti-sigma factor [Amycolatopsis lexingtonensis]|uniref:Anti-sigma factor antagonist n=1 Tax=Amycolatopsis lexingtonensis TaxID=218822 RepID=A0ABR9HZQ2_9PSEU|nr:STAS domain-containing protein [Amycolatopsis lexingtonensis]MBE1496389.1 anti-anti-sigma factor [Amycolatopsis lexingtonensis]